MSRSTRASNETRLYDAYSLSLLSEYTHTLDSLPLDLSRNFADLRELDAVLSSQMTSITAKIQQLTLSIEQGKVSKKDRLLMLENIAQEASNLKMGGDDKIRVACQAADNLKLHSGHMKSLLGHLPSFDMSVLNRQTTYPHVAARSFQPPAAMETNRRRRGGGGIMSVPAEPSPNKRKRPHREDEYEIIGGKTPRKEKLTDLSHKPRHGGGRKKYVHSKLFLPILTTLFPRPERAASPAESVLSVTSHLPHQHAHASSSRAGAHHTSNRAVNTGGGGSKRAKPRHDPLYDDGLHDTHTTSSRNRDIYNAPPASGHPSLGYANGSGNTNGRHGYDPLVGRAGDWGSGHLPVGQLEGPGMPVSRGSSSHPAAMAPLAASAGVGAAAQAAGAETAEGDGDGDDRTYCFCESVSYGDMIACDDINCEREWVRQFFLFLVLRSLT